MSASSLITVLGWCQAFSRRTDAHKPVISNRVYSQYSMLR